MNLSEAQSELAARGFDYLPASRMTIMLNDAKNTFEDQWEWPWLQATATGPAPLAVANLKYVRLVKTVDTTDELLGLDIRQLGQAGTDLNLPGFPEYWYITDDVDDGVTLRVWPVSDIGITIVYTALSPELVNLADEPLIPGRYHSTWIDLAVVQAYQDSDNFAGAQALRADIGVRLNDLIARYETRNRQHSQLLSIRMGSLDD